MINALKFQALQSWLSAGAPPQVDFKVTIAELGRRLLEVGVEFDLIAAYLTPKNPLLGGTRYTWQPGRRTDVREFTHAQMAASYFMGGVIERVYSGGRLCRYRPGQMPEFDSHPSSRAIIDRGLREFVAIPLITTTDAQAVFAVAVKNSEGLSDDQFEVCRRIAAPLARIVQSEVQKQSADVLLSTYLGRDAGARVSAGMVERGDAEMIRAVILFTDIVGFTAISNSQPIEQTVDTLNGYFEALEAPIIKYGGEVLKLMGDGLFAIFPTPDDLTAEESAALAAISAVADARRALGEGGVSFRSAYHVGELHYGNIGGLTRLDFTAIGPAVNLAARLLDCADRANRDDVCSAAFARLAPGRTTELGEFDFKGFDAPQAVYAIE